MAQCAFRRNVFDILFKEQSAPSYKWSGRPGLVELGNGGVPVSLLDHFLFLRLEKCEANGQGGLLYRHFPNSHAIRSFIPRNYPRW